MVSTLRSSWGSMEKLSEVVVVSLSTYRGREKMSDFLMQGVKYKSGPSSETSQEEKYQLCGE